jgi:hypothetical protein
VRLYNCRVLPYYIGHKHSLLLLTAHSSPPAASCLLSLVIIVIPFPFRHALWPGNRAPENSAWTYALRTGHPRGCLLPARRSAGLRRGPPTALSCSELLCTLRRTALCVLRSRPAPIEGPVARDPGNPVIHVSRHAAVVYCLSIC